MEEMRLLDNLINSFQQQLSVILNQNCSSEVPEVVNVTKRTTFSEECEANYIKIQDLKFYICLLLYFIKCALKGVV